MKQLHLALGACLLAGAGLSALQDKVTYDDTPLIPGTEYRVHGERPWPEVVTPGEAGAPPSDATVLFDGGELSKEWTGGSWTVRDGYAEVSGGGKITTRREFGDVQLHLEFATPVEVRGDSQGRGNSGVYLMDRYEIQVLDSFENPTYPDGQCSSMYGQYPPAVNASRGPGEWQSYDIVFHAPRFEGEELAAPARVTVFHNGVLVHHDREFLGATAHRAVAKYGPHGPKGKISLQDHGNPNRFRNVWVRELNGLE